LHVTSSVRIFYYTRLLRRWWCCLLFNLLQIVFSSWIWGNHWIIFNFSYSLIYAIRSLPSHRLLNRRHLSVFYEWSIRAINILPSQYQFWRTSKRANNFIGFFFIRYYSNKRIPDQFEPLFLILLFLLLLPRLISTSVSVSEWHTSLINSTFKEHNFNNSIVIITKSLN
jgi:hypothetical protein